MTAQQVRELLDHTTGSLALLTQQLRNVAQALDQADDATIIELSDPQFMQKLVDGARLASEATAAISGLIRELESRGARLRDQQQP